MVIRNILLAGGDDRALRLAPLLKAQGYGVQTIGLIDGDENTADISAADALLFPYPFSVKNAMVPTLTGLTLYPADVLAPAKECAVILSGAGLESDVLTANGGGKAFRLMQYARCEPFIQANAEISAEATVFEAMKQTPETLSDLTVLVTGYGRYGQATAKRLSFLGATVWVAARREKQRLLASSDGMRALAFQDIPSIAGELQLVINTVPAQILPTETLSLFPQSCSFLEAASAPYGFDREAAAQLGLHCEVLPALPARYAPQSAAKALMKACIQLLTEAEQ